MRRLSFLLAVLAALLLAGCASGPGSRAQDERASLAEAQYAEGDFAAAAQTFLAAAEASRSDRDFYLLRAAEAWRENGSLKAAAPALADINERKLDPAERFRLQLLRAEVALDARDAASARAALENLSGSGQQLAFRARLLELRGRAWQREDPFYAARVFAELGTLLEGRDRSDNAKRVRDLLSGLRDKALRDNAATLRGDDPLRPFAVRALTSRGYSIPPQLQRQPEAPDAAPSETAPTEHIVLLVPLSGSLQAVGEAVRDGFLSARFAESQLGGRIEVVDAGDSPASALSAYRQAVIDGATAVVGPLTRDAVAALFAESDLPVPVLALNRSTGPVPPGHYSFALAPEEEGAAIAARLQQRGLSRVVAVVSADDSSQRALSGLQQRLERNEGTLVTTLTIDERAIDFQQVIRSALESAGLPTALPTDLTQPHDPGFDAVFLAVRAAPARLLVPQLKLFGLNEIPMLGTSLLHAAGGDARLDRELSEVEFCDAPWLISEQPGVPPRAPLAAQLESARGPAARLFAFGMDAWKLLRLRDSSDPSMAIPGATGMLSIDEFGEAQREPGIAVFRNGRAQPVLPGELIPDGEPQG